MKRALQPFAATLVASVLAYAAAPASAQTATDPTVLATIQNQQAIADAQLKIQQDRQAMLTGILPASSATPNSGAYTVSGSSPYPSQKIAYDQLNAIAEAIAKDSKCGAPVGPYILYDSGEIANLVNYTAVIGTLTAFKEQTKTLKDKYQPLKDQAEKLKMLPPPVQPVTATDSGKDFIASAIPDLVLGGLKTATDIIGMFRTNTTIAYNSYTPDDVALTAAVAHQLQNAGKTVYLPSQMPLSLHATFANSAFLHNLSLVQKDLFDLQTSISQNQTDLQQLSDALAAYIAADQAFQTAKDQSDAETNAAKKKPLELKKNMLHSAGDVARKYVLALYQSTDRSDFDAPTANVNKAKIDTLLKRIATFATQVTAAATGISTTQTALLTISSSGVSPISTILRAEALLAKLNTEGSVVLSVKTSILGGSVVTRQNLFTGGHLYYTGGAIATYACFGADGKLLGTGVHSSPNVIVKAKY